MRPQAPADRRRLRARQPPGPHARPRARARARPRVRPVRPRQGRGARRLRHLRRLLLRRTQRRRRVDPLHRRLGRRRRPRRHPRIRARRSTRSHGGSRMRSTARPTRRRSVTRSPSRTWPPEATHIRWFGRAAARPDDRATAAGGSRAQRRAHRALPPAFLARVGAHAAQARTRRARDYHGLAAPR